MRQTLRELTLRVASLVGLGFSTLLVAEYQAPSAAACAPGGGCGIVRLSAYSHLFGIPLPIVGTTFFLGVLAIASVPRTRRWLPLIGALSVLAGLVFVAIQAFVLHAFCPLCLMVDGAALLLGIAALTSGGSTTTRPTVLGVMAQTVAALAVTVGAVLWHANQTPSDLHGELPALVQIEQKPNVVTIVEFVDFECPACREQYGQFCNVLGDYPGTINVVVKNMPLSQHQHAEDAARAYCCAAENGDPHAMADRLFVADKLGPEDCEDIAVDLGMNRDDFRRCVDSPQVTQRLDADREAAKDAGIRALPTFWIGTERFEGVHDGAVLRSSIDRALGRG